MSDSEFFQALNEAFAIEGFPLLEFDRKPLDRHILSGFVLRWNTKFTLMQVMENFQFRLNGYAIVRNSDVRKWRPVAPNEFAAKAARLNRLRPKVPAGVNVSSLATALSSAGSAFPLITIHQEHIDRHVCYVGKFLRTTARTATIRTISPEAEWDTDDRFQLKDITLLEFGGTYENLLARLAKPNPKPMPK